MPPIHRSRTLAVAGLGVFVVLGAMGFLPLFGGPGYEHSLASGLVVPSAAAVATALVVAAADARRLSPLAAVARGLVTGAVLAAIALGTALLHGIRAGFCDLWGGISFFALTAGLGALLGGLWGAFAGEALRGRRLIWCVVVALLGPISGVVVSIVRFYASPMVFAYDPFFGFFSGALYDTIVDVRPELWTYRAGSAATLVGAVLVAASLARRNDGQLDFRGLRHRRARASLGAGVLALAASLGVAVQGPALGHWQTASSIATALGGRASGPRCDIIYPDSLMADQVALLVRDCEEQLGADERRLQAHWIGRLTVFAFADANQKRRLMGAADTSIAKPWRREVYVQLAAYPHPVLGHEIAHVVAGSFAAGPFRVGGGFFPNPGLIEGIAVATSPDDDELTDAQWARAMLDLDILPRIEPLFSLDFLGQNASKSYTVAGAFVSWVLGRWGSAPVRAWYGGASIERLTGEGWDKLDDEFRAWLRRLPMPPGAMAYARARFNRPSVWARHCPHQIDTLNHAADQCRDEHRFDRALSLYDSVLSSDPKDWHARFDRAKIRMRYENDARGREDLLRIAHDDAAPQTWRDRAEEAIADDDLALGRAGQAKASYLAMAARVLDEDAARTLEVKALAAGTPDGDDAALTWLIGQKGRPVDPWLGALSLGAWARGSNDALSAYLVGKNVALHDLHDNCARASPWLDRASRAGAPTARIGRELLRTRATCACVMNDATALGLIRTAVTADDSPFAGTSGGRRESLLRFIARCEASGGAADGAESTDPAARP